ncbi:response regulator [Maritalea porphyrae]|jgi:PleD family two-component response regulator|uniref:response regulator n=1 Tax=Maritalea porphyrae TaxID=880732 RepID=UPI0022AF5C87|nr:response regulator [Maritalea porphyrae]MCZ4273532.1 response regulator [Maritalea porphyrae]
MSKYHTRQVVIVAEQRLIIDCVRSALRAMGISKITLFTKPKEAMTHMQTKSVDVLVLDDSLSTQNPLEFVAKLRMDKAVVSRFVPVILISDNGMPKTIMRAIKAGVDEVLVKPVAEKAVRQRIEKTIDNPRACISVPSGYVGPDRRRSIKEFMAGDDRRTENKADVLQRKSGTVPEE